MTYTYCAETTHLTGAEIVAILKHLSCCDTGEVLEGNLDMLRFEAGCDLVRGHAGPHAGYQAGGRLHLDGAHKGPEVHGWLFWGGAVREVAWPAECPARTGDGLTCLLFDGHEGPHLYYTGEQDAPAWLSHECRRLHAVPSRPHPTGGH